MPKTLKQYLGDGVYAEFDQDRGQIVLTAENGIEATDTIYLEAEVYAALQRFVEKINAPAPNVRHDI